MCGCLAQCLDQDIGLRANTPPRPLERVHEVRGAVSAYVPRLKAIISS